MQITPQQRGACTVLHLEGEFDTVYVRLFQDSIDDLVQAGTRAVVLDLRRVRFINSTALGAIIKASRSIAAAGGKLAISRPSASCREIIEKVGLERAVAVFQTIDDASASLLADGPSTESRRPADAFDIDETSVVFGPADENRIEHFISEKSAASHVHGHAFGKDWRGVGRMAGVHADALRFTWGGGDTGLDPDTMGLFLAVGTSWRVRFRLRGFSKDSYSAVGEVSDVEERPDGIEVLLRFTEIDDRTRGDIAQYAEDVAFLKRELVAGGSEAHQLTVSGSGGGYDGPVADPSGSMRISEERRHRDPVLLGAAAPTKCRVGGELTARFYAYVEEFEHELEAQLQASSPRSTARMGLHRCQWLPGTEVLVTLDGRHLEVDEPRRTFVWSDRWNTVEFDVTIPRQAPVGETILKFDVFVEGIRLATLRVAVELTSAATQASTARCSASAPNSAFASYASADSERVLDKVASIRTSAGLDVFIDHDPKPGEEWRSRLHDEIVARDLFLLFWSDHALRSSEVEWEWRTALDEKGDDKIQIHPLGPRGKPPPPEELRHVHFGESIIEIRESSKRRRDLFSKLRKWLRWS